MSEIESMLSAMEDQFDTKFSEGVQRVLSAEGRDKPISQNITSSSEIFSAEALALERTDDISILSSNFTPDKPSIIQNIHLEVSPILEGQGDQGNTSLKEESSDCVDADCVGADCVEKCAEGETQEDYYEPLAYKFEMVYNQISAKKKAPLSKLDYYQQRKAVKIEALRREEEGRLQKHFTGSPLLNSKSMQMLTNYEPIQDRTQRIVQAKRKKIELLVGLKDQKKKEEEEQVLREMEKKKEEISSKYDHVRSSEEYHRDMAQWEEKKMQTILQKRKDQQQADSCEFKPEINQRSKLIVEKQVNRKPIEQRQILPREVFADSHCTFRPDMKKKKSCK